MTTTDRLANAIIAVGGPDKRCGSCGTNAYALARLVLEVLPDLEDELPEAAQIIGIGARLAEERGARYGTPADNWGRTARLWEVILGSPVSAEQVGLCMVAVKLARLIETPHDEDSLRDLAGYAAAIQLLHGQEPTV